MGNANAYEQVPPIQTKQQEPEESDQAAINRILLTEDGKLTTYQASKLLKRRNALVYNANRLEVDEPFKKHKLCLECTTSRPTIQLRIAGKQRGLKIMLIQFKDSKNVYLQFETENKAKYTSSERNMREWLFNPSYEKTHHLVLVCLQEKERSDNIRFLISVDLKEGVIQEN